MNHCRRINSCRDILVRTHEASTRSFQPLVTPLALAQHSEHGLWSISRSRAPGEDVGSHIGEWVERRADEFDRRVNRLYLTDKVQEVMRALRKTAATVRREAIGDMSNDERDRFVDTLIKIKSNLLNLDANRNSSS